MSPWTRPGARTAPWCSATRRGYGLTATFSPSSAASGSYSLKGDATATATFDLSPLDDCG